MINFNALNLCQLKDLGIIFPLNHASPNCVFRGSGSKRNSSHLSISTLKQVNSRLHCSIARSLFHIQKILYPSHWETIGSDPTCCQSPYSMECIPCYFGSRIRNKKEGAFTPLGLSAFFSYLCFCLLTCRSKSFLTAFF
jgi:hypothetical protein